MSNLCLKCTLPLCDDKAAGCLYRLNGHHLSHRTKRANLRASIKLLKGNLQILEARYEQMDTRRAYQQSYYIQNRDRKLAAAKERHQRMKTEASTTADQTAGA